MRELLVYLETPAESNPGNIRMEIQKHLLQTETSYDLIPYQSHAYPQTHPDRFATLAHEALDQVLTQTLDKLMRAALLVE